MVTLNRRLQVKIDAAVWINLEDAPQVTELIQLHMDVRDSGNSAAYFWAPQVKQHFCQVLNTEKKINQWFVAEW